MHTRSILLHALALTVVFQGCASMHSGPQPATARKTHLAVCAAAPALPKEPLEPGSVLLFGEIHGVQELPSVFGEAVCSTAASGLAVEVGLEVPKAEQAKVDFFLASSGGPSDVETLLATPFWSREFQDGRSSQARVALLERFRQLRASGIPIHVFLFDINTDQDAAQREKTMSENIAAHVQAHPQALTMVLVGEVHAWKTQGSPWDPNFLPMGWHLEQAGLHVRSLGRSTPAGRAWICSGVSPGDCGSRETKATAVLPSGRTAGIELLPQPSTRGYDGLYGTPTLTPSPPAKS